MKVCAIVPTLNEEKAIKKIIDEIPNPFVNNIVVVDGHSSIADKANSINGVEYTPTVIGLIA